MQHVVDLRTITECVGRNHGPDDRVVIRHVASAHVWRRRGTANGGGAGGRTGSRIHGRATRTSASRFVGHVIVDEVVLILELVYAKIKLQIIMTSKIRIGVVIL